MTAPLKAIDGNAELPALMTELAAHARAAARVLALASPEQKNRALDAIASYRDLFGPDFFYLEVQEHGLAEQSRVNPMLIEASKNLGVPLEHACGGSCACTTCHVIIREGEKNLSEMQDDEADRLEDRLGRPVVRPFPLDSARGRAH